MTWRIKYDNKGSSYIFHTPGADIFIPGSKYPLTISLPPAQQGKPARTELIVLTFIAHKIYWDVVIQNGKTEHHLKVQVIGVRLVPDVEKTIHPDLTHGIKIKMRLKDDRPKMLPATIEVSCILKKDGKFHGSLLVNGN